MVVVAIAGILALMAIPNYLQLRERTFNASAASAGRNARTAQELYYNKTIPAPYTDQLSKLLLIDKNIAGDTGVTFMFIAADQAGFTINVTHQHGDGTVYTFFD